MKRTKPPSVRRTAGLGHESEQVVTEVRRDPVMRQELFRFRVLIKGRIEDVQRRIVAVPIQVFEKVLQLDLDTATVIVLATFEDTVTQGFVGIT